MKKILEDRYAAYRESIIINKYKRQVTLKKPFTVSFLDIDSTIADTRPKRSNEVRTLLDKGNCGIVFVTSRTEEILITEASRKKSKLFIRPLPHLGIKITKEADKKRVVRYYVDPAKIIQQGLLDPDVIVGSTGASIWIRQEDGSYMADVSYTDRFDIDGTAWRTSFERFLKRIKGERYCRLSPFDDKALYEENKTDVYPPDYRIQLLFSDLRGLKTFRNHFHHKNFEYTYENFSFTNDSKPQIGRFSGYVTPRFGTKLQAKLHILRSILALVKTAQYAHLNVLTAGDSWPDLLMATETVVPNETFILAGSSRLLKPLLASIHTKRSVFFAGEPIGLLARKLKTTDKKGVYIYTTPHKYPLRFVILDELYKASSPSESIFQYLHEGLDGR